MGLLALSACTHSLAALAVPHSQKQVNLGLSLVAEQLGTFPITFPGRATEGYLKRMGMLKEDWDALGGCSSCRQLGQGHKMLSLLFSLCPQALEDVCER